MMGSDLVDVPKGPCTDLLEDGHVAALDLAWQEGGRVLQQQCATPDGDAWRCIHVHANQTFVVYIYAASHPSVLQSVRCHGPHATS